MLSKEIKLLSKEELQIVGELTAFKNRLAEVSVQYANYGYNAELELKKTWEKGELDQVLLLVWPNSGCSFDDTELRYSNGNPADDMVFLKMNLFVRLWKKLGWTIEETDLALQVFLPQQSLPLTAENTSAAFATALLYLAHFRQLETQLGSGSNNRLKLLTLWADLFTTGKNSLYRQIFLKPSILKNDPVFDDPTGNYLSNPDILITSHIVALQAGLNLTAIEIEHIFMDAGKALNEEKLTLDTVSLLHRYGTFAKALALPVDDLIKLKALSGLTPFKPLSPIIIDKPVDDHPLVQTLPFVEAVKKIRESGFTIEELDYLFRHHYDPVGNYSSAADVPMQLIQAITAKIRQLQAEHVIPDAAGLTDTVLKQKVALILPPDAVELFLQMWTGEIVYQAVIGGVAPADRLDPSTFTHEPAIQVSYNQELHTQTLSYKGVLVEAAKDRLTGTYASPLLGDLLEEVQAQIQAFYDTYKLGFKDKKEFDKLFEESASREEKKALFARSFLPFLQQKLSRQLIIQALTASFNAEPGLTEALLTNTRLLTSPGRSAISLLDAFTLITESGKNNVSVPNSADSRAGQKLRLVGRLMNAARESTINSLKTTWYEGYVEVSSSGVFNFFVTVEKTGAAIELGFAHLPDPLLYGMTTRDQKEFKIPIDLKAGMPYQYTLKVNSSEESDIGMQVQGENLPKGSIDRLILYPYDAVQLFRHGYVLLSKALRLITGLGLTQREVTYMLTHAADFAELNLNKLPVKEEGVTVDGTKLLFKQFLRLIDYTRLKRELAGNTDELISIFQNARRSYHQAVDSETVKVELLTDVCRRLADISRKDVKLIQDVVSHLKLNDVKQDVERRVQFVVQGFTQEKGLYQIWRVLQTVTKFGVPVEALVRWTTSPADFQIAKDLRDTVKARFEQENWQLLARPIFDNLRQRQRNALVAYIMHQHPEGFQQVEQLFEYFLVDPGMEPVVKTSRLRLAISSVQLFVQRCLLNLEPDVHPSTINSEQWQWMKRYRVWEANRKIYLFPENLLEPEFRDDKTHLFQALEGALLQGDVSATLVEDAFYMYLKGLEDIGKLDIVAMYCEEKPLESISNTLHVFGRTPGFSPRYFYRRYAFNRWTPWEPVEIDIKGNHLVPVVWRERLHLFWVTFLQANKESSDNGEANPAPGECGVKGETYEARARCAINTPLHPGKVKIQLHWSEYYQGQWTTSESGNLDDAIISVVTDVTSEFNHNDVFIHLTKKVEDDVEIIKIHLEEPINKAFEVISKNSAPVQVDNESKAPLVYSSARNDVKATSYKGAGNLSVAFVDTITTVNGASTKNYPSPDPVPIIDPFRPGSDLNNSDNNFTLLFSANPVGLSLTKKELSPGEIGAFISPFFYQNRHHNFFVEPSLTETEIGKWENWGVPHVETMPELITPERDLPLQVETHVPPKPNSFDGLLDQPPIDEEFSVYKFSLDRDAITSPNTLIQNGGTLIGKEGSLSEQFSGRQVINSAIKDINGKKYNVLGQGGINQDFINNYKSM